MTIIKSDIGNKQRQPADAIIPRIVKITELLRRSFVTGLVLDSEKGYEVNHELTAIKLTPHRHILTPAEVGMGLGAVKCIFQDQETYAPIICYDEVYKFSIIQYDPKVVTLPLDAPPLSGVHLEEGSDVQVVTKSSDKVSTLRGKLRSIEKGPLGVGAISYSDDGASAVPGSPVLSADGEVIAVVTGTKSRGTDFILSVSLPLAVSRNIRDGGQGRGKAYINCISAGGFQHNGDRIVVSERDDLFRR